jgi:2-oxoglutarate/2-oxoacid ferredoxin oxidoreductase subunit beta
MSAVTPLPTLAARDFASDQEVRWCPGCGDFSILAQLKKALATLGLPPEKMVFVSGVGCAGRLPYYLNTYGFHTIRGRAPAVATGLKLARPDLQVWVITGDGDGLSAGANHLIHALRRNVDLKIVLFNNEISGLERGQCSPTSRLGTTTRSMPDGSTDTPIRPLSLALAAEASFVARTIDVDAAHLTMVLQRAAAHRGSAFVEIYQNCKVFNDGVFDYATDRAVKPDNLLNLEHGQPMLFGKDRDRGIRLRGLALEVVRLNGSVKVEHLLVHDETLAEPTLASLLSRMAYSVSDPNSFPEAVGVFRTVQRPVFGEVAAMPKIPEDDLQSLLLGEDSWVVE